MPNIPDSALTQMLDQLPPDTRKSLSNIVSGRITHQIICNGEGTSEREGCNGTVIAYLYADGLDERRQPKYRVEPVVLQDGTMRLRSSRKRLDGQTGFQCWCGNDSLIARQEAGSIQRDGLPPSRDGLEVIYSALQRDPATYPEINGAKEVDGFTIERVAV